MELQEQEFSVWHDAYNLTMKMWKFCLIHIPRSGAKMSFPMVSKIKATTGV